MASVIGNNAATPLRPTDGFTTFEGEIPRIGHKFPMTADNLRKLLEVLESPRYTDQQKFAEVKKLLMGEDRKRCGRVHTPAQQPRWPPLQG